jgi:hypothetical protein
VARLSLLLLTMAFWPASPARGAPAPTAISFAEQPGRLLRERAFYIAGRGVRLQDGDIIETGAAGIQLAAGSATIALGPASRVAFKLGARPFELILPPPLPKLERQAAFADVAPWLATEPALKQLIQRRYAPRKAVPSFSY